mgnify:FL=1
MAAIGVIGSGTWGTALSLLLCKNGCEVTVWSAIEEEITEMKEKRRHKNLPEVVLPEELRLTADLKEAMAEKDILVLAVPSVYIRATAARMKEFIRYGQIVINVSKRIKESSLKTKSQVIEIGRASCKERV